MFINFHSSEFQETLGLIGNMHNRFTPQYLAAGFGLSADFLPVESVFEKDKHKRFLNEDDGKEQEGMMKYTIAGHHPYSTTFIVFSIKNAEMTILSSIFFLVMFCMFISYKLIR